MQGNFTEPVLSIEPKISDLVELISRQVKKTHIPTACNVNWTQNLRNGSNVFEKMKKKWFWNTSHIIFREL